MNINRAIRLIMIKELEDLTKDYKDSKLKNSLKELKKAEKRYQHLKKLGLIEESIIKCR